MDDLKPIKLTETDTLETDTVEPMQTIGQSAKNKFLLPLLLAGIILGTLSGYFISQRHLFSSASPGSAAGLTQNPTSQSAVKAGDTFGTNDATTFTDQAEGILQTGGIGGEGTHHLVRGANASQWVYLTSSVVDLDMFIGDQVTVWGQTNQGKKAGWLMDVGKLKVDQLNAAPAATGSSSPSQD